MSKKLLAVLALTAATIAAPLVTAANAQHGINRGPYIGDGHRHARKHFVRTRGFIRTPVINRRIRIQARRIRVGRYNGSLTLRETRRLRTGLRLIQSARRFALLDRHVSFAERRRIHRMLDRNSRRIARYRNNRNDRYNRHSYF